MLLNQPNSMADKLGMKVEYKGVNGVKQHCFASGGPLVNHVYGTLEEAVQRFGERININERFYPLSAPFRMGYAETKYAPRSGARGQELIEYGLGYLKRLLESRAKQPVAPTPQPVIRYPATATNKPVTPVQQAKASPPQNTQLSSRPAPARGLSPKVTQGLRAKVGK